MKIERRSLAGQVAAALLERIGAGEWSVGTKLPGETSLAADLGVGRSTVREAVRDLAGRGVLDTRQGAGVFVVAGGPVEDWGSVVRRAAILDVVEGRLAVETEAAGRAARRRTDDDLAAMDAALARRDAAARSAPDEDYVDADIDFHRTVVAAAHNAVLDGLFESFASRVRAAMVDMLALLGPDDPSARHDDAAHAAVVEAVRDGDAERAAAVSRAHLTAMHERLTG